MPGMEDYDFNLSIASNKAYLNMNYMILMFIIKLKFYSCLSGLCLYGTCVEHQNHCPNSCLPYGSCAFESTLTSHVSPWTHLVMLIANVIKALMVPIARTLKVDGIT
jgi:uncharacterized membrane protein YjgN (DUF898 family)